METTHSLQKIHSLKTQQRQAAQAARELPSHNQRVAQDMGLKIEHLNGVQVYICSRMSDLITRLHDDSLSPERINATKIELRTLFEVAVIAHVEEIDLWNTFVGEVLKGDCFRPLAGKR